MSFLFVTICFNKTVLMSFNFTGPCKTGHYCLYGSSEELPCPPGTYSSGNGVFGISSCTACPAGRPCDNSGEFRSLKQLASLPIRSFLQNVRNHWKDF